MKSLQLEMVLKAIGASTSPRAEQVDVLLPVVCKNAEAVHTPGLSDTELPREACVPSSGLFQPLQFCRESHLGAGVS